MSKLPRLPYQIERVPMARQGSAPQTWRYDLVNITTGKVIASAWSTVPFPPKRFARRQAELNSKHFFNEVKV